MKASLEKYIANIFSSLKIENPSYKVYECKENTLPEWTDQIQITHEFLICCEQNSFKEKLQKFLGKEIYQFANIVYWFEGNAIANNTSLIICNTLDSFLEQVESPPCSTCWNEEICEDFQNIRNKCNQIELAWIHVKPHIFYQGNHVDSYGLNKDRSKLVILVKQQEKPMVDYLKTATRLPVWLDDFIFNQLNAEYTPDFQRFEHNLDLTEDENLRYLGTYFPRSYAESFCIFDNIFQNKSYQATIAEKTILNILSVGCGTGGDLIGLLTVIEKYCFTVSTINILAIDGNENALGILKCIVNKFEINTDKKIKLNVVQSVFSSIPEIDFIESEINKQQFDFILSFKMINEIISAGKGTYDNSYYEFTMKFVPLLSKEGLCVLLDVTTKAEHTTFNPILMNQQVNQAIQELKNYQTLLPLSCNRNEKTCVEQCFTQQKFYVSHKRKTKDISKVSYRVIAKTALVNVLITDKETAKYVLQRNGQSIDKFCPHSYGEKIIDGYKLKN
jgi:SAM-dependent methyltransferase